MSDVTADPTEQSTDRGHGRLFLALLTVAAVAVGFLAGFLARIPLEDRAPATPAADSVDVGFLQDMSVHHNQAIEMAAVAVTRSEDNRVRSLAYDILTTQQNQVGQMQGWLSLWGRPLLPVGDYMTWMAESEGHSHGSDAAAHAAGGASRMPGMASSEELAALRAARGAELDVLFLQLMLRHHQGGLPMMEYGAQYASTDVVRNIAQKMVHTQQGESELITSMLTERGSRSLPMN